MSGLSEEKILARFEQALQSGAIRPYFQPVIRTYTRQLCSFEVLARWVDPDYGMIYPDQFIPVLERAHQIHLLDSHIIRTALGLLRRRIDEGHIPVPLSLNLSRLDFLLCDIYEVVEKAAGFFQLPHEFIYIEITETVAAIQDEAIHAALDRFREAGFQIWMDDFGSGYSSLNVLKDLDFQEIKLDMRFLGSTNLRSKRIMASMIHMAKNIGIHTLAEGVENAEQELFLRNIGCEKLQGYYYGKPAPLEEAFEGLERKHIQVEKPLDRAYYDEIGQVNVLSAVPFMNQAQRDELHTARDLNSIPLALGEVGGDFFRLWFYNTAFEETARSTGRIVDVFYQEELNKAHPLSLLPRRLLDLCDSTLSGEEGWMRFTSRGQYYEVHAKCIAKRRDSYCVLLSVNNLSVSLKSDRLELLDVSLRSIYTLYDRITLLDMKADQITPLYVSTRENLLSGREGMRSLALEYAKKWIFQEDQKDYLLFADPDTIRERITNSRRGYLADYFRTSVRHGQYAWKKYTLLYLQEDMYLELIEDALAEERFFKEWGEKRGDTEEGQISSALLWENLMRSDILRVFWKDENRRFLGPADPFLITMGLHRNRTSWEKTMRTWAGTSIRRTIRMMSGWSFTRA